MLHHVKTMAFDTCIFYLHRIQIPMNKSTPLSQLPNATTQNTFINDQQRNMITQAQAAINTTTFPQNTQTSSDISSNDDDPAVQELLNHFNNNSNLMPQQMNNNNNIDVNQLQQQHNMQQMMYNQLVASHQQQQHQQQPLTSYTIDTFSNNNKTCDDDSFFSTICNSFTDNIKLISFVFFIYIIVAFIPLDILIGRYIAIQKIPYHQIILKALLASIIFMFAKKITCD